eukprot:CAMPEP_0184720424 /NCGR_PEP_ID=MMETSP0314-20130426/12946_1 /TAXON_ID=38298 /ORGANISM="Rhodella maculata, Strain CCMP 736" /LENGTH=65 /DNA_ID=CAMNT_0027184523 /DNA_START=102 /DNA_END=295 /DNA_ORIENTATION=+
MARRASNDTDLVPRSRRVLRGGRGHRERRRAVGPDLSLRGLGSDDGLLLGLSCRGRGGGILRHGA